MIVIACRRNDRSELQFDAETDKKGAVFVVPENQVSQQRQISADYLQYQILIASVAVAEATAIHNPHLIHLTPLNLVFVALAGDHLQRQFRELLALSHIYFAIEGLLPHLPGQHQTAINLNNSTATCISLMLVFRLLR
jgi:hypothetical protein